MKLTRKSAVLLGVPAAVLAAGGIGTSIALAATPAMPAPPSRLYGCVTGSHRAITNVYTVGTKFRGCPKGGFAVTVGSGALGPASLPGISGYKIFTTTQSFDGGEIEGAWCGAPNINTTNQGWVVIGGGAELTDTQVAAGVAVASSWPDNATAPNNPVWKIRLNKPTGVNPGKVKVYAVCLKIRT